MVLILYRATFLCEHIFCRHIDSTKHLQRWPGGQQMMSLLRQVSETLPLPPLLYALCSLLLCHNHNLSITCHASCGEMCILTDLDCSNHFSCQVPKDMWQELWAPPTELCLCLRLWRGRITGTSVRTCIFMLDGCLIFCNETCKCRLTIDQK